MAHPQGRYICKVNLIIWKIKNIYKRVTWKLLQEKLSCFFLCLVSFLLSKLVSNILVFYLRKLLIDFFIILHSDKGFGAINSTQLVNWISWRIAFGRGGQRKCPEKSLSVCDLTICYCACVRVFFMWLHNFFNEWIHWWSYLSKMTPYRILFSLKSVSKTKVKSWEPCLGHGLTFQQLSQLPWRLKPTLLCFANLSFCHYIK